MGEKPVTATVMPKRGENTSSYAAYEELNHWEFQVVPVLTSTNDWTSSSTYLLINAPIKSASLSCLTGVRNL